MSRVCPITGKGPLSGNKRSHSMRATKRSWGVNLQKVKVEINGQVKTIKVSAIFSPSFTTCSLLTSILEPPGKL